MSCPKIKPNKKPSKPFSAKLKSNFEKKIFADQKLKSNTEYSEQYHKFSIGKLRNHITSKLYGDNVSQLDLHKKSEETPETMNHSHEDDIQPKAVPYLKHLDKEKTFRDIITWPSIYLPRESEIFGNISLEEQADIRVDKIATGFADWWTDLGIDSTPELKKNNAERIKEMFSVDFDKHVARALTVNVKEICCVPQDIALANSYPQASITETIKRQVLRDIAVEAMPEISCGFGSVLSKADRFFPPHNDTYKTWIDIKDVPKKLETMETVWSDITTLQSTRDFYNWLRNQNNKEIPQYLKNSYKAETDEKVYKQPIRYSVYLPPVVKDDEDEALLQKMEQVIANA